MHELKLVSAKTGGAIPTEESEEVVSRIWDHIVKHITEVLDGASHGYEKYLELANPTIDEIVKSITKVDELMNKMLDGVVAGDLSVEVELKLNDCQQCIHLIRRVHVALKHDYREEYESAIRFLAKRS